LKRLFAIWGKIKVDHPDLRCEKKPMSVIYGAQAGQGGSHDLQDGPEGHCVQAEPGRTGREMGAEEN
jgi:hypothetical protein